MRICASTLIQECFTMLARGNKRPLLRVTPSTDSTPPGGPMGKIMQCVRGEKTPYKLWKQQFINDRMCDPADLWHEVLFALIPHLAIAVILIFYLISGALIFQRLDAAIAEEPLHEAVFFTFSTITTIGYGRVVPRSLAGQIFCVFYVLVGIPLAFLSLANLGRWLSDAYWILVESVTGHGPIKRTSTISSDRRLPLGVAIALLLNHSLIGGLIFRFWIDDIPFVDAVYFSFISITTIGFGDIVPRPIDSWHTTASIVYLTSGIVIMSALVARLLEYLRALHYIGRDFRGAAEVDVWFGGRRIALSELLQIVASHFHVSPSQLQALLRDLDAVICLTHRPVSIEESMTDSVKHDTTFLRVDVSTMRQLSEPLNHPQLELPILHKRSQSDSQLRRICVKNENEDDISEQVLRALGMVHHVAYSESSFRLKRRVEQEKNRMRRKSGIQ